MSVSNNQRPDTKEKQNEGMWACLQRIHGAWGPTKEMNNPIGLHRKRKVGVTVDLNSGTGGVFAMSPVS